PHRHLHSFPTRRSSDLDSVFVKVTDTLGTGGSAVCQGAYMNLVHSNTGFTLDVGHEVGLKRSLIHIMAVDSTRTGAVINFADSLDRKSTRLNSSHDQIS